MALWSIEASAGEYSGQWEYRALNAGDTNFNVEQHGDEIKLYRVLFPEYQGSRFKLEHIYKGRLKGKSISGFLFVREEGMKDFEKLRDFHGEIRSKNEMVVDDLPLVRLASSGAGNQSPSRANTKSKYSKVVFQEGSRSKQGESAKKAPEAEAAAGGNDAKRASGKQAKSSSTAPVGTIPKLVPVNRKMALASRHKADTMLKKGDEYYGKKNYLLALREYSAAYEADNHRLELLYKLGLCHGVLGNRDSRTGKKARAVEHYTKAIEFWSKATRLDPYNKGAKENIRRAKAKLHDLKKS